MLITEKDRKLNISFSNDENADIALYKDENGPRARIGNAIYGDSNPESSLWESGSGYHSIQQKDTACKAIGEGSSSKGIANTSKGIASSTEGQQNMTLADCAHAEGGVTTAGGDYSHTEGNNTVANNPYEHAEGHFNISNMASDTYGDEGNTIHSVGIGNSLQNRKNAYEIMQNGDIYMIGIGGYDGTNPSEASTLQEVIQSLLDK